VGRDVELLADPSVQRGGCVVEVDECVVDATVDGALSRVREVLAP
jgi:flagellar biosynthesis/type III secretory pathway protein FliH